MNLRNSATSPTPISGQRRGCGGSSRTIGQAVTVAMLVFALAAPTRTDAVPIPIGMTVAGSADAVVGVPAVGIGDSRSVGDVAESGGADSRDVAPYSAGLVATTVGQLLSADTSCTATMIPSRSGRIAVTAAHCVYADARFPPLGGVTRADGWIEGLVFYPGRRGNQVPAGRWPVTRIWVDTSFLDNPTPALDVAFLELADQDGATAQHALGAQGIAFHALHPASDSSAPSTPAAAAPASVDDAARRPVSAEQSDIGNGPARPEITVLGYPAEPPFDGTQLRLCSSSVATAFPGAYGQFPALRCSMTGGSSGGPWLTRLDPATGAGIVVAVTSFSTRDTPGVIGAAPLGEIAARLLTAADHSAGTTDAIPSSADPAPRSTASPGPALTPTPQPTATAPRTPPVTRTPTATPVAPPLGRGTDARTARPRPTASRSAPASRPAAPSRSAPPSPTVGIPFPAAVPPSVFRERATESS